MPRKGGQVGGNDSLKINYRIMHRGRELEASEPGEATMFQLGQGDWPLPLERAMVGAKPGDTLALHFKAGDELFGRPDPERIIDMELQDFSREPQPGELIEFELSNGEHIEGQVLLMVDDKIQVDFNHPYAGRELDIEIEIVSILEQE